MTLSEIEFDRVLTLVAMEAKSTPGKAAIARRRPHTSFEACERAQSELAEMSLFYLREGLLPIAGLTDVRPLCDRARHPRPRRDAREGCKVLYERWQAARGSIGGTARDPSARAAEAQRDSARVERRDEPQRRRDSGAAHRHARRSLLHPRPLRSSQRRAGNPARALRLRRVVLHR